MEEKVVDQAVREVLEGLRQAIQAERVGHELYKNAAKTTQDLQGRATFERLAQEELEHLEYLSLHYHAMSETGSLDQKARLEPHPALPGAFFSPEFRRRLGESHFEMSVLAIASQLELNAIRHYREIAQKSPIPEVRRMFEELAGWEQDHCDALLRQQQELQDEYWAAAGFDRG